MKNNLKILIGILIGFVVTTGTVVTAETLIQSTELTYDNSKSKGSYKNVKESLDELYTKAGYTEEEYHEDILNGAYPVLGNGMIPVSIDDNGDVYYANTHTKWYEYATKRWANAVILVDDDYAKNRQDNKDKYSVGDKISEEDIESYFVWIPRYAYKLWNLTAQVGIMDAGTLNNKDYASSPSQITENARLVDIVFGTKTYLDNLGYKRLIRNSNTGEFSDPEGIEIDDYLEHPGFTLGNEELNGFWIAKFEIGFNQANSGESAITGTEDWTTSKAMQTESDSTKVIIKPNVISWRNINISNMFDTAKGYKTELKSHMLKNTEWGAVAYLSHSAYGKGTGLNVNNAQDFRTGYSAAPNTNQTTYDGEFALSTSLLNDKYNTTIGYQASTTGNITGVYDMAGGVYEYVAAGMIGSIAADTSGFTQEIVTTEMKNGYIDAYPSEGTLENFDHRILGDATGEMAPFYYYAEKNGVQYWHGSWYGDLSDFLEKSNPWFRRGGAFYDGVGSGVFLFSRNNGRPVSDSGFRLALAP